MNQGLWIEFLDTVADRYPAKIALVGQTSGRTFTYSALREETRRWGGLMQELGVKPGDRVAYQATNSLEHVILLLACAEIGALFTPLNFRLAPGEILETLDRMRPALVLTRGEWQFLAPEKISYPSYRIEDLLKREPKSPVRRHAGSVKDPVLMLFTSGSSGLPKGVLLHGEMLLTNQRMTVEGWGLLPEDVTLVESPFFHTGGFNVLCLPLLLIGGTVVVADKFNAELTLKTIDDHGVSVYFAVPTMFQMLREHPHFEKTNFRSVRFFVSGGAACPVELIHSYQARGLAFKQGFGLTEVGPNCFLLPESEAVRKAGSIGRPMPHTQVVLLKDDGSVAGPNEVGEMLLAGPHVCAGYFQEEERFEKSLARGYFCTGDLAKFDDEGFFTIVGRKKEMFISGGENVYPAEVERAINSHPDILGSVVVPRPHDKWGEVGIAFVRSRRPLSIDELREYLNPRLSRYKQPLAVTKLEEFPLLASGKVNRRALESQAKDIELGA